jgi:NitT/TauT family transport system ATP-binding protein
MLASAQKSAAVSIDEVSLTYYTPRNETLALSNINLRIAPGEFVAIVGSSGCGKSTLLSLVSGLIRPSKGVIVVGGQHVTEPSPRVGYMFQKDTLLEWRTVLENTMLGAELLRMSRKPSKARAEELLRRYGLGDFLHAFPNQLSGGMRQRAALARTLCPNPSLLLLDEPFSALDYQTRLALSDEIASILANEGKTVILVTHDIGEAISMANRVIVMSRRPGRITAEHKITFAGFGDRRPTPLEARKTPEFNAYFETIWEQLDVHRAE